MEFQTSVQAIETLSPCKQPSNWPFVSTTQISHLIMSIKKLLKVTKYSSRKQISRISYQGQTQLDAVFFITEACFVIFLTPSFSYYLVEFIFPVVLKFKESNSCWAVNTYLVTSGFRYKIFPFFVILRHSLINYQRRKTLYE